MLKEHDPSADPAAIDAIEETYVDFYHKLEDTFEHYYRNLAVLLHYVEKEGPRGRAQARLYCDVISAQLSVGQRILLFYHCYAGGADASFRRLIEWAGLLEGLRQQVLAVPGHHEALVARYRDVG